MNQKIAAGLVAVAIGATAVVATKMAPERVGPTERWVQIQTIVTDDGGRRVTTCVQSDAGPLVCKTAESGTVSAALEELDRQSFNYVDTTLPAGVP